MGVQVGEHIARGGCAARGAGIRDADALLVANDADAECLEAETRAVARSVVDHDDLVVGFCAGADGFHGSKDFRPFVVRCEDYREPDRGALPGYVGWRAICPHSRRESALLASTLKGTKQRSHLRASRERKFPRSGMRARTLILAWARPDSTAARREPSRI